MKTFKLKIFSKNLESINWVDAHFFNRKKLKKNFKFIKKEKFSSKEVKKITILTSPHIDKDAQEQFSYIVFKKTYILCTTNHKKFLKYLKKLKVERFSDVKMVLTFEIQRSNYSFLKLFNNFFLDHFFYFLKKEKLAITKKSYPVTTKLLKVLDILGETFLLNVNKKPKSLI